MTTSAEKYNQINYLVRSLRDEATPFAKRFLDFISATNTHGYVDCTLPDGESIDFEDYSMDIPDGSNNQEIRGIIFKAEVWDWEDSSIVSFAMPFDYMLDPDAWEANLIERFVKEKEAALNALKSVAPGLIEGKEDKVVIESTYYMQQPGLLAFDFTEMSGGWDKDLSYCGKTYRTYLSWFFKPETNEVFYIDTADMGIISRGEIPALKAENFQ